MLDGVNDYFADNPPPILRLVEGKTVNEIEQNQVQINSESRSTIGVNLFINGYHTVSQAQV